MIFEGLLLAMSGATSAMLRLEREGNQVAHSLTREVGHDPIKIWSSNDPASIMSL